MAEFHHLPVLAADTGIMVVGKGDLWYLEGLCRKVDFLRLEVSVISLARVEAWTGCTSTIMADHQQKAWNVIFLLGRVGILGRDPNPSWSVDLTFLGPPA